MPQKILKFFIPHGGLQKTNLRVDSRGETAEGFAGRLHLRRSVDSLNLTLALKMYGTVGRRKSFLLGHVQEGLWLLVLGRVYLM